MPERVLLKFELNVVFHEYVYYLWSKKILCVCVFLYICVYDPYTYNDNTVKLVDFTVKNHFGGTERRNTIKYESDFGLDSVFVSDVVQHSCRQFIRIRNKLLCVSCVYFSMNAMLITRTFDLSLRFFSTFFHYYYYYYYIFRPVWQ